MTCSVAKHGSHLGVAQRAAAFQTLPSRPTKLTCGFRAQEASAKPTTFLLGRCNRVHTPRPLQPLRTTSSDDDQSVEDALGDSSSRAARRAARRARHPPEPAGFWDFPLRFAQTLSRVNDHYLMLRRRRRWWKQGTFPRVPLDEVSTARLPEDPAMLWRKVLPLGLVFFCASFNLTILQTLKDALMVTAGGAETLPWLASFCVLPASLGFFLLYGKLVSTLPHNAVFYAAVAPLLAFYALFVAVLFPAAPQLHPYGLLEGWMAVMPVGLHGLLKVVANWTYSLFFCTAELWGSVVISVLFWSLANDVCSVEEAKSVYPLMGISANVALVAAGSYMKLAGKYIVQGSLQRNLQLMVGTVLALSTVMFATKAYIDQQVPHESAHHAPAAAAAGGKRGKKKSKGSFAESLAVLQNSSKIRNLALLVMCYGVGHRLFEFAWKGQLRALHPNMQSYQSVLADVSTITGVTTIALLLTSRFVFKIFGWGVAAAVTPSLLLITGLAFFGCSVAAQSSLVAPEAVATLAGLGAAAGVVTQVFARASKYSLFDPAKEMVYIEMGRDEKMRGKAAVDLVGSQIGKSGGAWITQAFLLTCGSLTAALPYISVCFIGIILTWLRATAGLHRQMEATEKRRHNEPHPHGDTHARPAAAAADSKAAATGTVGAATADDHVVAAAVVATPAGAQNGVFVSERTAASSNGSGNGLKQRPSHGSGGIDQPSTTHAGGAREI